MTPSLTSDPPPIERSDQPEITKYTRDMVLNADLPVATTQAFRHNVIRDSTWNDFPGKMPPFDFDLHRRVVNELLQVSTKNDRLQDINQRALQGMLGDVGHAIGFSVHTLICNPFLNEEDPDAVQPRTRVETTIKAGFTIVHDDNISDSDATIKAATRDGEDMHDDSDATIR